MIRLLFAMLIVVSFFQARLYSYIEDVSLQLLWLDQFEFAGFYVAKEKGFYKEVGLNVEIKPHQKNLNFAQDVALGKTTYGIANSSLLVKQSQGMPLVILGSVLQSSPRAIVVKKNSGIKNINDLKNKKIMLTKDYANDAMIMAMLTSRGLELDDFKIVPHTYLIDDFLNSKVDAMMVYISNQPFLLEEKKVESYLIKPKDYGFDFHADMIYTSRQEIKNHPKRTKAFFEASMRGWKYAFSNIDETVELIFEKYNIQNKSKAALTFEAEKLKELSGYETLKFGQIDMKLLEVTVNYLKLIGLIKDMSDLDTLVWDETQRQLHKIKLNEEEREYLKKNPAINVCVNKNAYPFETMTNEWEYKGISAEILNLTLERIGFEKRLIIADSKEALLNNFKFGKCDIMSTVNFTPQRESWINFSDTYMEDANVIVANKDHDYIIDLEHSQNETIAAIQGSIFEELLQKDFPNTKIIFVKDGKEALQYLNSKKVDIAIMPLSIAVQDIHNEVMNDLKISGYLEKYKNKFCLGLQKDKVILKSIINKGLATISYDERLSIQKKYTPIILQKDDKYELYKLMFQWFIGLISIACLIVLWNILLHKKLKSEMSKYKLLQQEYFEQTKQAEIGQLIANISHQWREPLSRLNIINLLNIANLKLNKNLPSKDELYKQYETIESIIAFMSETMQNFLTFYKKNDIRTTFSVKESIEGVLSIVETKLLDNSIVVQIDLDSMVEITGIKNEWMQIWLNILNNSIDNFIQRDIQNPSIQITIKENKVIFCDNGGGIESTLGATGLGHKMCREIIKKNKGSFELENSKEGLCVKVGFSYFRD